MDEEEDNIPAAPQPEAEVAEVPPPAPAPLHMDGPDHAQNLAAFYDELVAREVVQAVQLPDPVFVIDIEPAIPIGQARNAIADQIAIDAAAQADLDVPMAWNPPAEWGPAQPRAAARHGGRARAYPPARHRDDAIEAFDRIDGFDDEDEEDFEEEDEVIEEVEPAIPLPPAPAWLRGRRPAHNIDDVVAEIAGRMRAGVDQPIAAPGRRGQARIQNEEQRRLRNMPYEQMRARHGAMTDRYFPDLSNLDNAFSALQVIGTDPRVTPAEQEALRVYVGAHATASQFNYCWCEECECMVGFENHTHCPNCIYPAIAPEGAPGVDKGVGVHQHLAACHNCGECCKQLGHRNCDTCHAHVVKGCRHCNKCTACCACKLCPDCDGLQECDCHKCYDHCTCPAPTPHPIYGKTFPAFRAKERKQFDCNRFAGIEWEYNRLTVQKFMKNWNKRWFGITHEDASCGFEAITPPVAGDYMVNCVTQLGTALEKSGTLIDTRCSIHVHADAKDMKWADMLRLLKVYAKLEPILYLIAGQDRLDNRYCLPCGKEYAAALERTDRKDAVMAVAFNAVAGGHNGVNVPSFGRVSQRQKPGRRADNHRYARRRGLNILPWLAGRGPRTPTLIPVIVQVGDTMEKIAHRNSVSVASLLRWNKLKANAKLEPGQRLTICKRVIAPDTTVEFRMHPNTLDKERVVNWTKIIVRLVDWSIKSTDKEMENLPKSPLRILCDVIAPECKPWILARFKEWRRESSRTRGNGMGRRISLKGGKYVY